MKKKNLKNIIADTVPVFFFIWDVKKRKIIYVSPKFYEMVNNKTPKDPIKDERDLKTYIDESCYDQYIQFFKSLSSKNDFTNKIDLKTTNFFNRIKWIEIRTFPVEERGQEVELVVGHIVDITDRKEKLNSLEGQNRNFDTIMQLISHDMRQPFTKITLLADLIKMDYAGNEQISNYMDKIKAASSSANDLLQSFLQLTVLNYSQGVLSTTNENLCQLIEEAVEAFDVEIEQKKLTLNVETPNEKLIYPVDPSLFKQLIRNIISNSIKFTYSGGTITIKLTTDKIAYNVCITDTGLGIPERIKANLFKGVDESVQRTGLEGQKSTGLGLIIAKKIAELHNGSIDVESKEGKGTTFSITLPLAPHHHIDGVSTGSLI